MKTSLPRSSRPVRTARAARSVAVVASVALIVGAGLTGTASAQDVEGTRAKVDFVVQSNQNLYQNTVASVKRFMGLRFDSASKEVARARPGGLFHASPSIKRNASSDALDYAVIELDASDQLPVSR